MENEGDFDVGRENEEMEQLLEGFDSKVQIGLELYLLYSLGNAMGDVMEIRNHELGSLETTEEHHWAMARVLWDKYAKKALEEVRSQRDVKSQVFVVEKMELEKDSTNDEIQDILDVDNAMKAMNASEIFNERTWKVMEWFFDMTQKEVNAKGRFAFYVFLLEFFICYMLHRVLKLWVATITERDDDEFRGKFPSVYRRIDNLRISFRVKYLGTKKSSDTTTGSHGRVKITWNSETNRDDEYFKTVCEGYVRKMENVLSDGLLDGIPERSVGEDDDGDEFLDFASDGRDYNPEQQIVHMRVEMKLIRESFDELKSELEKFVTMEQVKGMVAAGVGRLREELLGSIQPRGGARGFSRGAYEERVDGVRDAVGRYRGREV